MLKKIDKVISLGENSLTGLMMLLSVVVLFVNVMMRYFFHAASSWVEEALRYACIWVTFIGGSQCVKKGTHVGVDLVVQLMPAKIQKYFVALGQFIAAIFTGMCVYAGYNATMLVVEMNQKSPAMLMPMWIVYISIPLGCLLMCIRFIISGLEALLDSGSGASAITDESGNIDMSKL